MSEFIDYNRGVLYVFLFSFLAASLVIVCLIYWYGRWNKKQIIAKCGHPTSIRGIILFEGEEIPFDLSRFGFVPDKCIDCLKREALGD